MPLPPILVEYLTQLGFSDKERTIYTVLAEVGVQPASVIARRSGLDRVTTYKHLKKLAEKGLVKVYVRDTTQCFGIESFDALEGYLRNQLSQSEELLTRFPTVANVLRSLRGGEDMIPKLQIFEGEAGIRSLFRDMLFEVKEASIGQIRMLSSNTFEEWLNDPALTKIVRAFFVEAREKNIDVELLEVTGGIVPERVRKLLFHQLDLENLPVARGTTNIFIVGHTVYVACYKSSQIGLKIKQAELSQIFHFLFDVLGKVEKGNQ